MFGDEIRSNQPDMAVFYPPVLTLEGEEKRYSALGSSFWCKEIQAKQTSKEFREAIESLSYSLIIGSTNISKLRDVAIDSVSYRVDNGGQVEFDNALHEIQYAKYEKARQLYYIALR